MNLASHQLIPEGILPENFTMTLEEFLESDVDGYEYVKGELVPMPAPSVEHGLITVNVLRQLDAYVHENQLGIVVCAETSFKVGERVLKPDIAFTAASRIPEALGKTFPAPPETRGGSHVPLRYFPTRCPKSVQLLRGRHADSLDTGT